jgi:hypothetical protein
MKQTAAATNMDGPSVQRAASEAAELRQVRFRRRQEDAIIVHEPWRNHDSSFGGLQRGAEKRREAGPPDNP